VDPEQIAHDFRHLSDSGPIRPICADKRPIGGNKTALLIYEVYSLSNTGIKFEEEEEVTPPHPQDKAEAGRGIF